MSSSGCAQTSLPVRAVPWVKDSQLTWSEGCPAPSCTLTPAAAGPAWGSGTGTAGPHTHPTPAGTDSIIVLVRKRNGPDGPMGRACLPNEGSILDLEPAGPMFSSLLLASGRLCQHHKSPQCLLFQQCWRGSETRVSTTACLVSCAGQGSPKSACPCVWFGAETACYPC